MTLWFDREPGTGAASRQRGEGERMILTMRQARQRYPGVSFRHCEDPRHETPGHGGVDDKAAAVVSTVDGDLYAVCEGCMSAIVEATTASI